MAEDMVKVAVETVGRHIIAAVLDNMIGEEWENYPEIGEDDWMRVQAYVEAWARNTAPPTEQYEAAYEYLESRASDDA